MTGDPPAARPPYLALAIAAAACGVYLASELFVLGGRLGLPLDDGWIHLQFARQLAAGAGLAYDPAGPWVSGSTAPLWTALLSPGFLLPAAAVAWSKLLGVAFFLATVDAAVRLAGELGLDAGRRRLAAVLVAASHWLVWSALSGLEIGLFCWLSLWGMIFHLRERAQPGSLPRSLPVLALAALARPEGYLLLALAAGERLAATLAARRQGAQDAFRDTFVGVAAAAVLLLPVLIFYRVAGGSFLPTTFAVKSGLPGDLLPSGSYLRAVLGILFDSQPVTLLLAGAGVLRLIEERRHSLLPALWLLGLPLAYAFLAPAAGPPVVGNFGRYFFPLLPVVVVLGVLGLERAARGLGAGSPALRSALLLLLLAPQIWGLYRGPLRYLQTVGNVEDSDVAAARWLAGRLDPGALLAVQDIGALKYFLPNPIVDLTGIVNPDILPVLKGSGTVYWEERLRRYLERRRPDYLVVFPASYPMLTGQTAGFDKVRGFPVAQNVTMAGDELAIFTTPWTRHPLAELP